MEIFTTLVAIWVAATLVAIILGVFGLGEVAWVPAVIIVVLAGFMSTSSFTSETRQVEIHTITSASTDVTVGQATTSRDGRLVIATRDHGLVSVGSLRPVPSAGDTVQVYDYTLDSHQITTKTYDVPVAWWQWALYILGLFLVIIIMAIGPLMID